MSKMFADASQVRAKGQAFVEYGQSLRQLLLKISDNVDDIAANTEGSAVNALLSSYEDINNVILSYSKKIVAIGNAVEETAQAKESVNEAAAQAAAGGASAV